MKVYGTVIGGETITFLLVCVLGASFMNGKFSLGHGTLLMRKFSWIVLVSVAMMQRGITKFTSNLPAGGCTAPTPNGIFYEAILLAPDCASLSFPGSPSYPTR